jgi:hypothetical protein
MAMLGIALTCAVWMAASPAGAGRPPDEEKAPEKEKAAHDSSQEAAGEAEKKEYPPQDPSLGAIAGRIVLKGPVPAELSKIDPVPSKDHANCGMSVKSDLIVLSKRQEIKDVVISIDGYTPPAKPAPRTIVLDNKKCLFVPRVQATTVGSQIKLTNSDNFLHNSQGLLAANFNPAIPPGGSVIKPLPKAGWLLVKCSFHPWMTAHVQIFPHELFDVTGADGAYRLVNAPPGEYDIRVWHERLAPVKGTVVRTKVRVEAGKTLDLDLELEAKQ